MRYLIFLCFSMVIFPAAAQIKTIDDTAVFVAKPYLQVGKTGSAQSLQLLWHANDSNANWAAEYRFGEKDKWIKAEKPVATFISIAGIKPFAVYRQPLNNLTAGSTFTYRIFKNKKLVFSAKAKSPKSNTQPFRFVASGDMGAGTKEAREIAAEIYKSDPDLVAIAGDIVYEYGLVSEYSTKFWPIYNTDQPDTVGAPLLRSIPFIAAVGNHDADSRDLDKRPDALAYYMLWDQPLNGPEGKEGGAYVPVLRGSDSNRKAFLDAAGERYPRMTNFSYNYGNAHWTVIDADTYVDWTDKELVNWVAKDLADSKDATWHFVLYHHPGFNSSREHYEQQQMRLLAPVFEKGNVDIVFNGHVHNYQRTFPIKFIPDNKGTLLVGGKDAKTVRGRVVTGQWILDKTFDGKNNKRPSGILYIISGAGGQELYNPEQTKDPDSWQKFTDKFISTIHSFTVVDIDGTKLKLRQVDKNGNEIDSMEIIK